MNDYEVDRAVQEKMNACAQETTGCIDPKQCVEPPFRDRLQIRLHRARGEARKAHQIEELLYLLDKQPEVARLLELVEAVGR